MKYYGGMVFLKLIGRLNDAMYRTHCYYPEGKGINKKAPG
jgi:hypothetical protein